MICLRGRVFETDHETPETMSPTLHALVRFWWIVAAGLVAAVLVAVALAARQPSPIYTASENVLVTSPSAPYLRTVPTGTTKTKQPVGSTIATDTQALVNAAGPLRGALRSMMALVTIVVACTTTSPT